MLIKYVKIKDDETQIFFSRKSTMSLSVDNSKLVFDFPKKYFSFFSRILIK